MNTDPLETACRTCGAHAGDPCTTPAGYRCTPHSARKGPRKGISQRPSAGALEHREAMDELRPRVFTRDGHACVRCGTRHHLQAHHRLPTGRGGPDTMENLVTLCGPAPRGCHGWVHDNDGEARALGLLFASWDGAPSEPWTPPAV